MEKRLFQVLNTTEQVYGFMQGNPEQYQDHFEDYIQNASGQSHAVNSHQIQSQDQEEIQQGILFYVQQLMEQSVHFSSGFLHLDIVLNEQLFAYYLSC
jgi:hypothetical protein